MGPKSSDTKLGSSRCPTSTTYPNPAHTTPPGSKSDQPQTLEKSVVRACVLSRQSCLTLCDPMDCSPLGSSVHGDSPGKNTGVVAMPSSRGPASKSWLLDHLCCCGACWGDTAQPTSKVTELPLIRQRMFLRKHQQEHFKDPSWRQLFFSVFFPETVLATSLVNASLQITIWK